jgi:DNA gyrase subunit B
MDPSVRKMFKVNIEDAAAADEIFKILLWEEGAPRRRLIQTRAKEVQNLDI